MRHIDVPLQHMIHIVTTWIVLHNMCTISKDKFDREFIEKIDYCKKRLENKSLRDC